MGVGQNWGLDLISALETPYAAGGQKKKKKKMARRKKITFVSSVLGHKTKSASLCEEERMFLSYYHL